jgi:tetratricopeptide (TPR) repeat protein
MLEDSYDRLWKRASRLEDEGDIRGALELWREISQRYPDSGVLCRLAGAARDLGELEEAEESLLKAVEFDSGLRLPYIMLCLIANKQGRWEDAELRARQALRIEEGPDGYSLLGIALRALGRAEEAHRSYSRGIELDPSYEELYFNFGVLVSESDPASAESLFTKAIELDPDYAVAHRELGWLLLQQNVLDEAEYHLRRTVDLDPADTWGYLYLGLLFWRKNDIRAAVAEYQWAHASTPDWPVTMRCLADIYSAQEEWARAEDLYHRALAVQPDSIAANKGLAKMYMRMGRTELAQTYFGRVLLLNPDDQRALECMEEITGDYGDISKNLARRLQRHRSRWERRQDPGAL